MLTLHRPSNVDDTSVLNALFAGIGEVARDVPLVFPVHPRTRRILDQIPVVAEMVTDERLRLLEPIGYLEFLGLMADARVVLTDSGGGAGRDHGSGCPLPHVAEDDGTASDDH